MDLALNRAVVGGGCFWCIEAVFQRLKGVRRVRSGYAGGKIVNPTYEAVCTGTTGHAEVVEVTYAKSVLPYYDLLYIFMSAHDATTLNRQGNDVGTQYRSVIFYETEEERETGRAVIAKM
jgi:methionine-S-sulfoxide reductase